MKFTPRKINTFLFFKLPSAFLVGVRVKSLLKDKSVVYVTYKWINQNPFKSMFWAVQGMAAELSTGILVMREIHDSNKKISMLVTNMNANFFKKATGKIVFECIEGALIREAVNKAIETKEGQKIMVTSRGINTNGEVVSEFQFEWSLKIKS